MQPRTRFTALYEATVDRVMAYCLRHLAADHAEDAVHDTFLVAWRRLDSVPEPPLPWLLTTAHNIIRNRYRSQARALDLTARLAQVSRLAAEPADVAVGHRGDLLAALGALTDDEREAVLLIGWDGLSGSEAAAVLGISHAAFRVRLHRARRTMADALTDHPLRSAP